MKFAVVICDKLNKLIPPLCHDQLLHMLSVIVYLDQACHSDRLGVPPHTNAILYLSWFCITVVMSDHTRLLKKLQVFCVITTTCEIDTNATDEM